jgi:hypothetical protein
MKHLLFIILILTTGKAFSQAPPLIDTIKKYQDAHAPVIAAKDAYKYVGKMVIVKDSLYSSTIINDTTTACQMGEKTNTPRLTLLYTGTINKHANGGFFNNYKRYRLWIYGTITGTRDAPVLILRGGNNLTFDGRAHDNEH